MIQSKKMVLSIVGIAVVCMAGCQRMAHKKGNSAPSTTPVPQAAKTPLDGFKVIMDKVRNVETHTYTGKSKDPALWRFPETLPEGDESRQRLIKGRDKDARAYAEGYQWVVTYYSLRDLAYDIQKTDSLVSPYTAYIRFTIMRSATPPLKKSQAEAKDLHTDFQIVKKEQVIARYAYQEGRWVQQSLQSDLEEPNSVWQARTFSDWWSELEVALRPST